MVLFLMQEMPSKRKQVRKIKRSMRKNVQRAKQSHEKQSPNQDMMLKLMALFGNKSGAQPSMDPAKFLEQQETKASRDAEIRKLKLQAEQTKSDNAAANQQHKIDVAKAKRDDAQRKALQNQELLEVEKQLNGIQGGIRNLNIQTEQARHQIKMNTKYGDLEAEKAKRDKLKTDLRNLRSSINYMAKDVLTPDNMAIFKHANSKIEEYINALNGLEKDILLKRDTSRKQKLVEAKAAELETSLNELLDINQRLKFDIDQEKDSIKIGEGRVRRMRDLEAENNELEHKLARTKLAAENAGFVYNRDENGKPIKVYDEKLLLPEIKPEDDEHVQYCLKKLKFLSKYLNDHIVDNKDNWSALILNDFKGHEKVLRGYKRKYEKLPARDKIEIDNEEVKTFDDLIKIYKEIANAGELALYDATERHEHAVNHNKAVRSLPMPTKTEVTEESIAKLKLRQEQLRDGIDDNKREQRYRKSLEREYQERVNKINRLEAELNNSNPGDVPEELVKELAELKKKQSEIEKLMRQYDKKRKRVEDIEDQAEDLQFRNNINSQQLQESPESKRAREKAEEDAIAAKMEAERQQELNDRLQMTHKSEQDKRVAEMTENAARSDKIRDLDDKIVDATVKGKRAEKERQKLEELEHTQEHTRRSMRERDIQKKVTEHMKHDNNGIEDATTTLITVADTVERELAAEDRSRQETGQLLEQAFKRLEEDPYMFKLFNQHINGYNPWYESVDAVRHKFASAGNPQEGIEELNEFMQKYDNGEIQDEGYEKQ